MSDDTKTDWTESGYRRFMRNTASWDDGIREERKYQPKKRKCLMCGKEMDSRWAGDRYHSACRDTARTLSSNIEP